MTLLDLAPNNRLQATVGGVGMFDQRVGHSPPRA
jgi:hypothetical protein